MQITDKEAIFKEISLFAKLSARERQIIKERSSIREYKKGEIIYQEGSPVSAFYCVILGRVKVFTQDASGKETVLEYLHRGKYFGIISLLTGDAHSVTAKAINDCLILVIDKPNFDYILEKLPQLAIDLSKTLSRRLKNKDIHQKTIFESSIISIFSSYSPAGRTVYALNMALSLSKESFKSVILLELALQDSPHILPVKLDIREGYPIFDLTTEKSNYQEVRNFVLKNSFGIDLICLSCPAQDVTYIQRLLGILSLLVNDYHYIILDLPSKMDRVIFDILNQSDAVHLLTSPESVDLKKTQRLMKRLKTELNFPEEKIKVIINEYKYSRLSYQVQSEILGCEIFATLPRIKLDSSATDRLVLDAPNCEYTRTIRRVSRHVGDCLVGLTLGVGVAYGFCHLGVLKVIEEEKIPIDVISGSSIGALLAALWAIGKSSQEILEITREFKEPKYIWGIVDLTFPILGFIKGNKLYNFLKRHLGSKTFYDVILPLKVIASDIKSKESKVIEKGLLADAIMASCSMPGVFRPFVAKEELLFDGGVTSPLPTEVLFKMGLKKIIAVNVTPSREDILRERDKIKAEMAYSASILKQKGFLSFAHYFKNKLNTNILDIVFSSFEIMQSELAQKEAQLADVVLHPDIQGLHWMELHKAEEFAKRGEAEARRCLNKIWQIIRE
jgi:NTE family protein